MMRYDVVIVGGGGAGLCAALAAARSNLKVALISKQNPLRSQTVMAQGGMNAALDGNTASHVDDTLRGGDGLASEQMVRLMCEKAPHAVQLLDRLGVAFDRDEEGNLCQRSFGGGAKKRTCYSADRTGQTLLHTLYDQVSGCENVDFLNDRMLLNIDTTGKKTQGVSVLNIPEGTIELIKSSSVVVASGGYGGVYFGQSTNSSATTGEGIAASARAGAYLRDMEFVQFHPTTLESSHLISEAARAEGGFLVDEEGNRFVDELSTRDLVARAIGEVYEREGKVFLDLRHLGEEKIDALLPQERMLCQKYAHLDPAYDLIPIKPSAHYTMGGVAINERCETKVKGLFVCGEASCSGVHGANRLGGNSLLEIVVFGDIAGEEAVKYALENSYDETYDGMQFWKDETAFVVGAMNLPCQIDFYEKRSMLGKIMSVNVGLFKEERYLKAVMGFIRQAQDEYPFMGVKDKSRVMNTNLVEFIEFGNMLQLAEMIVVASLNRMESRGSHFRRDFPARNDDAFKQHSLVWLTDGVVHMEFEETLAKLR